MAVILRGKRKGEEVKLHQWANDWASLEDGSVVSITNLLLNPFELKEILEKGTLWFKSHFEVFIEGPTEARFRKIRR